MIYSESTKELLPAYQAFQAEIKHPLRTADNPFYSSKYTPLDALIDHVKPVMKKNGLYFAQEVCSDDNGIGVITTIFHTSGEYMQSAPFSMGVSKKDPQAYGGAITYARRYALSAMLGIASNSDDDAEGASHEPEKPLLNAKHEKWNVVIASLTAGNASVEYVESKFSVAPECREQVAKAAAEGEKLRKKKAAKQAEADNA